VSFVCVGKDGETVLMEATADESNLVSIIQHVIGFYQERVFGG